MHKIRRSLQTNPKPISHLRKMMALLACLGCWYAIVAGGCSAPATSRCGEDVCEVTLNRACSADEDCCCTQACSQGRCLAKGNSETSKTEAGSEVSKADSGPADNPATDTPVTKDQPGTDTPTPDDVTPRDDPATDDPPTDDPPTGCTDNQTRPCYDGPTGTKEQGECKSGTQTCTNGVWGDCKGQTKPTDETCDGKDNNCDGQVDETTPNVGQACQVGKGECQATGKFVCTADGKSAECDAEPGKPRDEICDAKDNNCDGQVDEGCKCKNGDTQDCYSAKVGCTSDNKGNFKCTSPCEAGEQKCKGGQWGKCENEVTPKQEVCDGKDNDCDGVIDNGFPTKGQNCTKGQGSCKAAGKLACTADGSGVECDAKTPPPAKETCNGKDDDCDGDIDEAFATLGQSCTAGQGLCVATGKFICKPDGTDVQCNAKPGQSSPEKCDGKDNDCDGNIDNGFANLGKPCSAGTGNCVSSGRYICKADGTGTQCNVGTPQGTKEVCNGKDDDCDGSVDEDFPTKGQSCSVGVGECQEKGNNICKHDGTGVICNATPRAAKQEECNNKDDDCDGAIDENVVRSCSSSSRFVNIGICRSGLQVCYQGRWSANCSGQITRLSEGCSNAALDGDCDGQVDENCPCQPNASRSCGNYVGECSRGTQKCGRNQRWGACQGEKKPVEEVCDGKDNDCDGRSDENWPNKGRSCSVGRGACLAKGNLVCRTDGKGLICNAKPGTPKTEVCDGIDNDCDGRIDEGCP